MRINWFFNLFFFLDESIHIQFKKPIPLMAASIRGMLRMFQNQRHTARQELSHALYQQQKEQLLLFINVDDFAHTSFICDFYLV
ncbi:hypothetical protein AB3S75_007317 [Citrus x aurantiifolia]